MDNVRVKAAEKISPITAFSVFDFSLDVYGVKDEKCPRCGENSLIEIGQAPDMNFVPACKHCCFCGWTKEVEIS